MPRTAPQNALVQRQIRPWWCGGVVVVTCVYPASSRTGRFHCVWLGPSPDHTCDCLCLTIVVFLWSCLYGTRRILRGIPPSQTPRTSAAPGEQCQQQTDEIHCQITRAPPHTKRGELSTRGQRTKAKEQEQEAVPETLLLPLPP